MAASKTTNIRTFTLVSNVSGFLEGGIEDWPRQMQDAIYSALEIVAQREELPLTIISSRCDVDPDYAEGAVGRFFVEIIASEIVVADERTLLPGTVTPKGLTH